MQDPHVDIAIVPVYIPFTISIKLIRLLTTILSIIVLTRYEQKSTVILQSADFFGVIGVIQKGTRSRFGEYSLRQYRYAKEYYKVAQAKIKKENGVNK